VVVFRRHVILGIEMLSKWRLPCIVDRIFKIDFIPLSNIIKRIYI